MLKLNSRTTALAIAASVMALAVGMSPAVAGPTGNASFTFNSNEGVGVGDPDFIVNGTLYFNATPLTNAQYLVLNQNPYDPVTNPGGDSLAFDAAAGFTDYQATAFNGYIEAYDGKLSKNPLGLVPGYYNNITVSHGVDTGTGWSATAGAGTNFLVTSTGIVYGYGTLGLAPADTVTESGGPNDNILGVNGSGTGAVDDEGLGFTLTGSAIQTLLNGTTALAWFDENAPNGNGPSSPSYVLDNGQEITGGLNIHVPEPFTLSILGGGLIGLGMIRRRKGKAV